MVKWYFYLDGIDAFDEPLYQLVDFKESNINTDDDIDDADPESSKGSPSLLMTWSKILSNLSSPALFSRLGMTTGEVNPHAFHATQALFAVNVFKFQCKLLMHF